MTPSSTSAEDAILSPETTYPVLHASAGRHGRIPARTTAAGQLRWTRELPLLPDDQARHLLLWQGHVVLVGRGSVALIGADGKAAWSRPIRSRSAVAAPGDLLFAQKPDHRFDGLTLGNEARVDGVFVLPAIDHRFTVPLLWPAGDGFVAVVQHIGQGHRRPPVVNVSRARFGETFAAWELDLHGKLEAPPLLLAPQASGGTLLLAGREVVRVDTAAGKEMPPFPLPATRLVDWSTDGLRVYVAGVQPPAAPGDRERSVLLALAPDGKEQWRWSALSTAAPWVPGQPPVVRGDGSAVVLKSGGVLAIGNGKLLWDEDLPGAAHATALSDDTVLVAAGSHLVHLTVGGEQRFDLDLGHPLIAPPVVDGAGQVFALSARHLHKVR